MNATDKKYYIEDTDNNLYKLNTNGRLVQAACIEEASVFSLQDAKSRIGKNKKGRRLNLVPVSKPEVKDLVDVAKTAVKSPIVLNTSFVKEAALSEKTNDKEDFDATSIFQFDLEGFVHNICQVADHMPEFREVLTARLIVLEQECSDLYHYIEFMDMTEKEHANLSHMLQDRRRSRRKIKNQLARLNVIAETIMDHTFYTMVHRCVERMEEFNNLCYRPRQMPELFNGTNHYNTAI